MTLNSLVLGLIAYPRVVEEAHKELDRVVGASRLPSWEDEKDLPYIRAIVKEVSGSPYGSHDLDPQMASHNFSRNRSLFYSGLCL